MRPVKVLIFHASAPEGSGPLTAALASARRSLAERQVDAFLAAGADEARIVEGPADGRSFGERLSEAVSGGHSLAGGGAGHSLAGGLVVLGSGSVPLATPADLRRFVEVATGPPGHALANNRYSADIVAISRAADLAALPPLPADNALPRWLEEQAGVSVTDVRTRWRLGVDIDTPLDLVLLGQPGHGAAPLIGGRLTGLQAVLRDRRAELLVAGRVSAATLSWLEERGRLPRPRPGRGARPPRLEPPGPGRPRGRRRPPAGFGAGTTPLLGRPPIVRPDRGLAR